MTLPYILAAASGRCHEAPAPGGLFQDDFTSSVVEALGGRTATGPNSGWVWQHTGTNSAAFETEPVADELTCLGGAGVNEQFYVDSGGADHFSEITFAPAVSDLFRQRGPMVRGNASGTYFFMELRFTTTANLYEVIAGVASVANVMNFSPAIAAGDTIRLSASGNNITAWLNGVSQETYDASLEILATPSLGTAQNIGLRSDSYTSNRRMASYRGGTGDGS